MRNRRGFTLIEVLVTLGVVSIMIVGMLTLLDSASRVSKEQTNLADAQAASRSGIFEISRILRQARVGQLYYANAILPWVNNAAGTESFTDLNGTAHTLRAGTDAVEARGIIYGDLYWFSPNDVQCAGGNCTGGSAAISVTIQQKTPGGSVNYPAGGAPSIASRTRPFYFVITSAKYQQVSTANGNAYATPLYYVGKVNIGSFAPAASSFTFTMDATDVGARALNATTNTAPALQQPFSGGPVDDIVFFVDRGPADTITGKYIHPVLSQAVGDPQTGNWDVQPIAEDVEDFQVSYGVDGSATGGASPGVYDGGVDPAATSTSSGGDEWVYNTSGESLAQQSGPTRVEAFINTSVASSQPKPEIAVSALKSIMLSLVVKSHDPDLRYKGPGAYGVKLFDSSAVSISDPTLTGGAGATSGLPFRRRVQTMAVNLRNYL